PGGLPVVLEDLMEGRQEGLEDRGPLRLGAAIAGRLGVVEDLLEGLPVDLVLAAGGTPAEAIGEDATADLGPVLHVGIHPVASLLLPSMVGLSASIVGREQGVRPRVSPISAAVRPPPRA